MEPGVLDGDCELNRQRREQGRLVRCQLPPARGVDGEQADQLLGHEQRNGDRGLDPGGGARLPDLREPQVEGGVVDHEHPASAERPEREVEQPFGHLDVGAGKAARFGGRQATLLVAKVDGEPVDVEQARDAVDRDLERVAQRQPCDRLAEDAEKRLRALEVARETAGTLAEPQRVRRAYAEACEPIELVPGRHGLRRKAKLEQREGRAAERDRRDACRRRRLPALRPDPRLRAARSAAPGERPKLPSGARASTSQIVAPTAPDASEASLAIWSAVLACSSPAARASPARSREARAEAANRWRR